MRNNRVDWLLSICALGVVAIHIPIYFGMGPFTRALTSDGFCGVAVYLFFIVSGYFLAAHVDGKGWWKAAVCKRLKTLLVPYVIWCTIYGFVMFVLGKRDFGIVRLFGLNPLSMPYFYPFWFIRNLFLLVVISPMLVIIIQKWGGGAFVLVGLAGLSLLASLEAHLIPGGILVNSLFYFMVGLAIRLREWRANINRCASFGLLMFGVGFFALRAANGIYWHVDALRYAPLIGIGGWMVMLGLWGVMPNRELPRCMRGVTFPVYALHVFVLMALAPLAGSPVIALAAAFCGAAIMGHGIKRFLPRVAGVVFGGR